LQYLPSEKELDIIARNLPIQVDGDPSEEREVSNYKDIERIETNRLRNGFCLVLSEGIALKAPKLLKILNKLKEKNFKISEWDWLSDLAKMKKVSETKPEPSGTYIKDLVAGRPVLGHPSVPGGFRLRYGRARTTGYSAVAIHPATMKALDDCIAIGTQIRTERPGKSATVTACDSMEPPIVKFKDGSVARFSCNMDRKNIQEILYLGDILISYGDFFDRNHPLMPAGYNEEWWMAEFKLKNSEEAEKINSFNVSLEQAVEISEKYGIPLHPRYIFFWSQINYEMFFAMLKWIEKGRIENGTLILAYSEKEKKAKRAFEILGIEHKKDGDNFILDETCAKALFLNLGKRFEEINELMRQPEQREGVLEFINSFSKFKIRDKAKTFIGARMGRPEKAKLRELIGSPHGIFPVGEEGGKMRSIQEAIEHGNVKADFPLYYCEACKQETIFYICETCGSQTKKMNYCPACERIVPEVCPQHGGIQAKIVKPFMEKRINIKHYFDAALKKLNLQKGEIPKLIKGVRGTSSASHTPEHLTKAILRSMYGLRVNKDGTIRYDATEAPITHFKPCEIGVSALRLKELGYNRDAYDKELENENQVLELKPQDIILPACPDTLDEKADDVFVNMAKFVDNMLVRLYGLKPFYNVNSREDLLGHLIISIAPHNAAGVVGRIIGFSETQALFASPYIHAAMRRDCDGDEAAVTLLLDTLINFSRQYLPAHRGATQDAPLILNARVRAGEVDDMVFNVDIFKEFPIEFYEAAELYKPPYTVKLEKIKDRLLGGDIAAFKNLWYTHDTININHGPLCSSYKTLASMEEKVKMQMELAEKIRAVDTSDVARLVIERHFIRDIRGNLRKFSGQQFRCVDCNEKFRRPPLTGKCSKCEGKIIFTIAEGSIVKYLEPAINLAEKYNISDYLKQSLELTKSFIESIFGRETEKQEALGKWF
jgi:DNA polymerase II large subunit